MGFLISNFYFKTKFSQFRRFLKKNKIIKYVSDAIDKVADRLIGPYNVVSVVEPLNIKISEAVMNFQEIGADVSQKIQTKCGTLGLKRQKRKAGYENPPDENPNMEIRYETMKMNNGKSKKHKKVQEEVDQTPTLDKLIDEIKVVSIFFAVLHKNPFHVCFSYKHPTRLIFQRKLCSISFFDKTVYSSSEHAQNRNSWKIKSTTHGIIYSLTVYFIVEIVNSGTDILRVCPSALAQRVNKTAIYRQLFTQMRYNTI